MFNVKENQLSCGRLKAELQPIDGKIRLRILVDRTTIEIFANDGRLYMPCKFRKEDDNTKLAVFARGDEAKSTSLQVRELESIWE